MGRIFLEQMSGEKLFDCRQCKTNLSSIHELMSLNFIGAYGQAYLFHRVINVNHGAVKKVLFLTGTYHVRDVFCKVCNTKLGWFYEMAQNEDERYKEGKTVLEVTLIKEIEGLLSERCITFIEDTEL